MNPTCPKGHASTAPDYCSECGARIQAAARLATTAAAPASIVPQTTSSEPCPDCGTPRAAGPARFCEVCRYNFETGTPWTASAGVQQPAASAAQTVTSPPAAAAARGAAPAPAAPGSATAAAPPSPTFWRAVVAVDPALYIDPDPEMPCPTSEPERTFPLDLEENLIGRPSPKKGIRPEVPVKDDGVSHRHAKLVRASDGYALLDLGSTNGTKLNGKPVEHGVPVPLADGDQITLGAWTRITVRTSGRR